MTDSLLQNITGETNEAAVKTLQVKGDQQGRIKIIEGLANYTSLRALDLSCHLIARIEGLSSLKQLTHLSLADNKIGVLQGLNRLHSLEELDLSGNSIETIGTGLESLSKLRVLRLARNRISQVTQFEHLSPLKHLSSLSIHGNPVSELPHCQGYVIFCARSLDVLDGEAVSDYAREGAIRRFTKAHDHEMEAQLVELEAALEAAKQQAAASEQALNDCRQREERALERNGQLVKENEKLQMELNLKHQRLEVTLKQLSTACARISAFEEGIRRVSLPVAFRTSDSSLASDVSAELTKLEANDREPRVTFEGPAEATRASGLGVVSEWERDGVEIEQAAGSSGVNNLRARAEVDGAKRTNVVRRSLGFSLARVDESANGASVIDDLLGSVNGDGHVGAKGDERGPLLEIENEIQRSKAALTEFLEELGLKEDCAAEGQVKSSVRGGGRGLSRGSELVGQMASCVEEQAKLKVQLQQVWGRTAAIRTSERACPNMSERQGAEADLSFSNLVGPAEGPREGSGDFERESAFIGGDRGVPETGYADAGLSANPGSVDCSLSEETDVVVMSDSEAEGGFEAAEWFQNTLDGAPCKDRVDGRGKVPSLGGFGDLAIGKDSGDESRTRRVDVGSFEEEGMMTSGREVRSEGMAMAQGEGMGMVDEERMVRMQLERSEVELQKLQEQALADVAASYRLAGRLDEEEGAALQDVGADVAGSDWPEETRFAAHQFLRAMTAHLAGLFEEYHSLLAASWHGGTSDGCHVAPSGKKQMVGPEKQEPRWDLLFSAEKDGGHPSRGIVSAAHRTPRPRAQIGFELQSVSATPGSEQPGLANQSLDPVSGHQTYRYADVMLEASPESVVFGGGPLRSAMSSPSGEPLNPAPDSFASWAKAGLFSDAGTQSECRAISDASVQCNLELPDSSAVKPAVFSVTTTRSIQDPSQLSFDTDGVLSDSAAREQSTVRKLTQRYEVTKQAKATPLLETVIERPALQTITANNLNARGSGASAKGGRRALAGPRLSEEGGEDAVQERSETGSKLGGRAAVREGRSDAGKDPDALAGRREWDMLRRRCRTLECQVAALTGLLEAEKAEKEMLERWQEETERRSRQSLAARIADPPPVESSLSSRPQQDDVTAEGTTQGTRPPRAGSRSAATEHEDDVIRAQLTEREELLGEGGVRESESPGLGEAMNRDSEVTSAEPTGAESPGAAAGSGCLVEGKPGTLEGILSGVVERQRAELKALQEQLGEAHRQLQMQEEGVRVWEVSGGEEKVDSVQAEWDTRGRSGRERNGRERNGREWRERGLGEMEGVGTERSEIGRTESGRNEEERTDPERRDAETQWEWVEERTEWPEAGGMEHKSDGGQSDSGERQDGCASMEPSGSSLAEEAVSDDNLRLLEGLLSKFEAEIGSLCTLGLLVASVRACKGLLVREEGSPEAGEEAKRVAGQSGRHQALLRLLEGAREQRRLAEATLNGVRLHSETSTGDEASVQGTAARKPLAVTHETERRGQAALVDLLIGLMCKVACDEMSRRQQVVSEALGPGLGEVCNVIRRRTDEAWTSGTEAARELRREVSGFLGLVGSKEDETSRALERLREAADSVVSAFCELSDRKQSEIFQNQMDISVGKRGEVVSSWKGNLLSEAVKESAFRSEVDGLQEILKKMQLELASLQQQLPLSRSKVDGEEGRFKRAREEADRAWQEVRAAEREALEVKRQARKVREKSEQEALEVKRKASGISEQEESKAEAERARLREEVQGLREGVWKAEAELWRVKEEGLRVREEVSKVKGELAAIQGECQHAKEQREGFLENADVLETRIRNLKDEMQSAEDGVDAARERARESRKEAHLAAEAAGKSTEKLEELEGLAQEAQRTVGGLEKGRKIALERLKGTESALRRGEEEVLRVQQRLSQTEEELKGLKEEERLVRRGLEGGRRELEKVENRLKELRTDQDTVERHVAEARAQLRELEIRVEEKGQQAEGAERERNGRTDLEAGAVLREKLAALQGELMDVQVHLLASRRECQSEEERALRASREADVARNELALLKETALSARREAETAQEEARIAGAALEAVKRRLEGMVTGNRVRGGRGNVMGDGGKTEGSLVGVLERVLANLEGGEGSEEIAGVKEELRGLEERVSEKEERLKVLEERLRGAKESVAAEEGKLKVLSEEARSMAEGVGQKRGQKVELEEQCSDLQNQVKTLTEKVTSEAAHVQKVKAEVKTATDELERVKERVTAAESKLDSVKEETAQAKQVYRRVKEEVREAKLDLSKTRHELNDLKRRWMGLKLEVTGTRNSVNKLDLLSRFKPGGLSSSLPEPLGSNLRTVLDDAKRTAVRTSDPAGESRPHDNQTNAITDSDLLAQRELAGPIASAVDGFTAGKRHRSETKTHGTDGVRTASETRQGERAVSGATIGKAEAQLRDAQNGLEELLFEMHTLQQRVAHVSESDVSRTAEEPIGRQASESLETLAESSLAACLEGVRQVHAQLRKACESVAPEGALRSGKADMGKGESGRTRREQGLRRDAELWALEEVCGQMRKDLRRLAERNEVLQQVLRCGSGPPGGVNLAGCSARRPCEKCVSLNWKFLEISREAARLRLLMKTLKARIVELLSPQPDK